VSSRIPTTGKVIKQRSVAIDNARVEIEGAFG
jgi:hypothetical protein